MVLLFISVLMLSGSQAVEQGPPDVTHAEIAQAWASGDASRAREVFDRAFTARSEGPCAISPYTAQLAYRTGLLWRSGYHFSMALLIDAQMDALTGTQREVAQQMRTEPGELISEDRQYLYSPYLDPDVDLGVCADYRMPVLPDVTAGEGEDAIIVSRVEWRGPRLRREISDAIVLDAYPPSEGAELAARMVGLRTYHEAHGWRVEIYEFNPCYQYSFLRRVVAICRPGFERTHTGED